MESGGRWVWRARAQGARQQRQGPIQAQPSNKGSYFLKLLYTTRVDEVVIYLYISFEYMCRCSKMEAMSSKKNMSPGTIEYEFIEDLFQRIIQE